MTTNRAEIKRGHVRMKDITLCELLEFIGLLFYMKLTVKGELQNYWGFQDPEDLLFGSDSQSLDRFMSFSRFKLIRQVRCRSS